MINKNSTIGSSISTILTCSAPSFDVTSAKEIPPYENKPQNSNIITQNLKAISRFIGRSNSREPIQQKLKKNSNLEMSPASAVKVERKLKTGELMSTPISKLKDIDNPLPTIDEVSPTKTTRFKSILKKKEIPGDGGETGLQRSLSDQNNKKEVKFSDGKENEGYTYTNPPLTGVYKIQKKKNEEKEKEIQRASCQCQCRVF